MHGINSKEIFNKYVNLYLETHLQIEKMNKEMKDLELKLIANTHHNDGSKIQIVKETVFTVRGEKTYSQFDKDKAAYKEKLIKNFCFFMSSIPNICLCS